MSCLSGGEYLGASMVGKTPRARKNDKQRMETIAKHCSCLPCLLVGYLDVHATIEHVTERGRRAGKGSEVHQHTIGLCTWHHFGHTPNHVTRQKMSGDRGPSLVWGRTTFEEFFGDEVTVLLPCQDFMLDLFDETPWPEYSVPGKIARKVRDHWITLNHATHRTA